MLDLVFIKRPLLMIHPSESEMYAICFWKSLCDSIQTIRPFFTTILIKN